MGFQVRVNYKKDFLRIGVIQVDQLEGVLLGLRFITIVPKSSGRVSVGCPLSYGYVLFSAIHEKFHDRPHCVWVSGAQGAVGGHKVYLDYRTASVEVEVFSGSFQRSANIRLPVIPFH